VGKPQEFFNVPFLVWMASYGFINSTWLTGRGECLYENLIPENITLSGTVESLEKKDKEFFLDFVSHALHWLPEIRKSAKELAAHPWLKDL
jgi:hypothetical protein